LLLSACESSALVVTLSRSILAFPIGRQLQAPTALLQPKRNAKPAKTQFMLHKVFGTPLSAVCVSSFALELPMVPELQTAHSVRLFLASSAKTG